MLILVLHLRFKFTIHTSERLNAFCKHDAHTEMEPLESILFHSQLLCAVSRVSKNTPLFLHLSLLILSQLDVDWIKFNNSIINCKFYTWPSNTSSFYFISILSSCFLIYLLIKWPCNTWTLFFWLVFYSLIKKYPQTLAFSNLFQFFLLVFFYL